MDKKVVNSIKNKHLNKSINLNINNKQQIINKTLKIKDAFIYACKYGHLDIIKYLLKIEPKLYVLFEEEEAFYNACMFGHLNVVKYLLEIKSDIVISDYFNQFLFCKVCEFGYNEVAKYLLEIKSDLLYYKNIKLFNYACEYGYINAIKFMLQINLELKTSDNIICTFIKTCEYGHFDIAEYLMQNYWEYFKNNLYEYYDHEYSCACKYGKLKLVKSLDNKIQVIKENEMYFACIFGKYKVLKYLLQNINLLNFIEKYEWKYLIYDSCKHKQFKIVKLLLKIVSNNKNFKRIMNETFDIYNLCNYLHFAKKILHYINNYINFYDDIKFKIFLDNKKMFLSNIKYLLQIKPYVNILVWYNYQIINYLSQYRFIRYCSINKKQIINSQKKLHYEKQHIILKWIL